METKTKLTEDQLKEIVKQVFSLIDSNSNGSLDQEELRTFFKDMAKKHENSPAFDEERFVANWKKMDLNSDGKIELDELTIFMREKAISDGQMDRV